MFESPAFQRLLERLANEAPHDPSDAEVRLVVRTRARDVCEYCLMPTLARFEVDHIVPVSRWREYFDGTLITQPGESDPELDHLSNFAWSCSYCNGFKGELVSGRVGRRDFRLFNPRRDLWNDHFVLTDGYLFISGLTEIGRATERVLAFNDTRRNGPLAVRHKAIVDGIYPPVWARGWGF